MYRDREGNAIDLMTWAGKFGDLGYRVVCDDVVVPTPLHVRTVWEGIEDLAGCMFATGVCRLFADGAWSGFVTFAESPTEEYALQVHDRIVRAIRESSMQLAWSEVVWRLGKPYLWAEIPS